MEIAAGSDLQDCTWPPSPLELTCPPHPAGTVIGMSPPPLHSCLTHRQPEAPCEAIEHKTAYPRGSDAVLEKQSMNIILMHFSGTAVHVGLGTG